jgi:arginyl-tRNA synthetase
VHEPPSQLTPLRARARDAVSAAWERAVASGALPAAPPDPELPAVEIERPAKPEHGDLATGLAMKLARPYRMPPLRIAQALADELGTAVGESGSVIAGVAVAPPGFLNLRLADGALESLVAGVLAVPEAWGRVRAATPRRINVEFVSANPTGPLHIGNARGAFVGDLLCRVLEAAGNQVTREYYFNDFGAQVRNLGGSVVAIRRGDEIPATAPGASSTTWRRDPPGLGCRRRGSDAAGDDGAMRP